MTSDTKSTSVCRNCGGSPTIRAHLIPKAFALDIREGGPDMKVGSINQPGFKFSKAGFFDDNILCAECDGRIGVFDDYAVTFCRAFEDNRQMIANDIFSIEPVDTDRLVRFAVSVCWRYSISTLPNTNKINLGPFEENFQKIIFGNQPVESEPSLVIWANRSRLNVQKIAFAPTMHRHLDRRHCSMILAGLSFILKVDSRPLPSSIRQLCINGKDRIVSGYKPFDGSFEYGEMLKIIQNMSQPRARHQESKHGRS
jgi:hypothetical protein